MLYRIRRFAVAGATLLLLYLTVRFAAGSLSWGVAAGSVLLSTFWLGLILISARRLFASYHDYQSRLRFRVPVSAGMVLSAIALATELPFVTEPGRLFAMTSHGLMATSDLVLLVVAALNLLAWSLLLRAYLRNSANFLRTDWGFVRRDIWLNPPMDAIPDLCAFVSSGSFGPNMKNPSGHMEVPFTDEEGKRWLLSSWIGHGTVIHPMDEVIGKKLHVGEHYFVRPLRVPPTPEQLALAPKVARQLLAENVAWKTRTAQRREAVIGWLPLPTDAKEKLAEKAKPSGYWWKGLLNGRQPGNRGTCIGVCKEFLSRLGIEVLQHGYGFFGGGTGWFTPLNPGKIPVDPHFVDLTVDDQRCWEQQRACGMRPV
jgi:hypothetical protein